MEIVNIDFSGFYSYGTEINNYNDVSDTTKECIICKRSLYEPDYDQITNNKNIMKEQDIVIGKCGHIFHGTCLEKWLDTCDTCPIDKVKWCLHTIADSTTCLVVKNKKFYKKLSRENRYVTKSNKKNYQKNVSGNVSGNVNGNVGGNVTIQNNNIIGSGGPYPINTNFNLNNSFTGSGSTYTINSNIAAPYLINNINTTNVNVANGIPYPVNTQFSVTNNLNIIT